MWTHHILFAGAALAVTFAGALATERGALAQLSSIDIRQEDRQADRQAERQEDRRADRREDRQADREMEVENERAEVQLALPRTATGAIDTQALLALVRDQIAGGAREIQFRTDHRSLRRQS